MAQTPSIAASRTAAVALLAFTANAHARPDPLRDDLPASTNTALTLPNTHATNPRPLAAEPNPYTIAPGRLAIEAHAFNIAHDRSSSGTSNERVTTWSWPLTFRAGITQHTELQVTVETYTRQRSRNLTTGRSSTTDGFGDTTLAIKHNFWGNDGGPTAAAITPFVRLPTHRHDLTSRAVEGGAMVPLSWALADEWFLDVVPQLSIVRDSNDDGYEWGAGLLTVLTYDIAEDWSIYAEFEPVWTTESGEPWWGEVRGGAEWRISDDLVLDGGIGFGVTRSADDISGYLAIITRF